MTRHIQINRHHHSIVTIALSIACVTVMTVNHGIAKMNSE